MKVLYSSLKQYIPELKIPAHEVADALTLIGYMNDRFEEVTYQGETDYVMSLEVRQNRADCFSVIGIAREVAAYYGLPFQTPDLVAPQWENAPLEININAVGPTRRVLAVRVDELKQQPSPVWLKEFLMLHGMNSISLLVDLSNYVMLVTGYPSHLIDANVIQGSLSWSFNTKFDELLTLNGTSYPLSKDGRYILIHDEKAPIALAAAVGARYSDITEATSSVIVEVAVYDPGIIRDNMRSLHIVTEAGNRLSKDLDPDGAYDAFCMLVSLLTEHAGGQVASSLFEYYPTPISSISVEFDPALPGKIAGIDITNDQSKTILTRLSFQVNDQEALWSVAVPAFRTDVSCPEDLAEEVIRMVGYDRISIEGIPALPITPDITPVRIRWSDIIHDILVSRGYDEIRSLPLVSSELNASVRYRDEKPITTQNTANEEYPELRQSVLTGMLLQKEQYQKRNVNPMQIFEYGKAFGAKGAEYVEYDMLALAYIPTKDADVLTRLYEDVLVVLGRLGLHAVFQKASVVPTCANSYSCWDIIVDDTAVGICFVLNDESYPDGAIAEINIDSVMQCMSATESNSTAELTTKLVDLDTNVVCSSDEEVANYVNKLYKTLEGHVWSILIVDRYPLEVGIRYTLRMTYRELSDTDAKALHNKTFELTT